MPDRSTSMPPRAAYEFFDVEITLNKHRIELRYGAAVMGTVWRHVCGFSWCQWHPSGARPGGDASSIEDGKQKLLACIAGDEAK